ncbi:MerR family transcriptional regulator [Streptosporangiaceae bacterium NEAU-GS5]|nr:MerR family transcriptional regulator [Streptosporangiaceae bacterium NEAU-GS5]
MFSIGDFAQLGRVSVRMLRHYDALGLLTPAHVDTASGYRYYEAAQLARLNRLLALKDLGFTLQQVGAILDDKISVAELHGMLRLRRAEVAADLVRLASVEARLRVIEKEGLMADVVVKSVPAVRLIELAAPAKSYETEDIGPVIQPLYAELSRRVTEAGLSWSGPAIAYYTPLDGDSVLVHAGAQVVLTDGNSHGFDVVDLPALAEVAAVIHQGPMEDVQGTWQGLAGWIEENGYRPQGMAREVYLNYGEGDPAGWVTELQWQISR